MEGTKFTDNTLVFESVGAEEEHWQVLGPISHKLDDVGTNPFVS